MERAPPLRQPQPQGPPGPMRHYEQGLGAAPRPGQREGAPYQDGPFRPRGPPPGTGMGEGGFDDALLREGLGMAPGAALPERPQPPQYHREGGPPQEDWEAGPPHHGGGQPPFRGPPGHSPGPSRGPRPPYGAPPGQRPPLGRQEYDRPLPGGQQQWQGHGGQGPPQQGGQWGAHPPPRQRQLSPAPELTAEELAARKRHEEVRDGSGLTGTGIPHAIQHCGWPSGYAWRKARAPMCVMSKPRSRGCASGSNMLRRRL